MKNYINKNDFKFDYPISRGVIYAMFSALIFIFLWGYSGFSGFYPTTIPTFITGLIIIGIIMNLLYYDCYFETGREFDLYNNQYRKYFSSGKLRIGKWKLLGEPESFLIKKVSKECIGGVHIPVSANGAHTIYLIAKFIFIIN